MQQLFLGLFMGGGGKVARRVRAHNETNTSEKQSNICEKNARVC